ncbi:hypothetical protein [Parasphingorhabdus sp.]|uniref:hypothetical protein n=1 Tax=Parasphingorhabdus sp. TaxID=2709688 RepID=UPI003BAF93EA
MSETVYDREQQAEEQGEVQCDPRAAHKAAKKRVFLEQLTITSSIKQSREVAGIPNSTLHSWKNNDPDFAAAWLKALAEGYALLEMEMLERARHGVERKIFYHGKHVETVRDYDHKTALTLLRMHKETVALVRAAQAELAVEKEPVRDTLDEKLKKINVRLRAFQAEKRRKRLGADHDEERASVIDDA